MAITTATGATRGVPTGHPNGPHAVSFAILKEFYTDAIRDQLNNRTVALKYMKRATNYEVDGSHIVIPMRISRNEGHGHVAENAALPDPVRQGYARATYITTNFYGRMKFTGQSAAATKTRRGSFLDIVDSETTGLVMDMSRDMNRIVYGDGGGRHCRIQGTGATTSDWVTDYPGGFQNTGPGTQYLRQGMRMAIINATTGAITAVRWLIAVNYETQQVTFGDSAGNASSVTLAAGTNYFLTRVSHDSSPTLAEAAFGREPFGLAAIVSDENPFSPPGSPRLLGQIDRSTVPIWRSNVMDNGGTPVDLQVSMLNQMLDMLEINGDATAAVFLTTHGARRAYLDQLQAARTYPSTMKFDGGYETVHHSGRPIVPDRDCTAGRIYAVDFDAFHAYYEEDYHWMEMDGSFLSRMPDQDAYQATLVRYHQFGTDAPNQLGVIMDIRDA